MKTQVGQEALLDRGGHPTLREILTHLVFSPIDGSIMLNDARLVLQRASYNAHLRDELVRIYGRHDARVLLTRLGFRAGTEDAKFVEKSWPHLDLGDAFTAGTRLHTASGIVRVETVHNDFDFRKGKFSGEFLWRDSVEAMEYLRNHGASREAVCWSQLGYASGYASHFFNNLIVYKEVQCVAKGDAHCRVVGKTAETWGENDETVRMYRDEVLRTSRPISGRRPARNAASDGCDETIPSVAEWLLAPVTEHLDRVAEASIPLLITGARGTGKRAAARYVHATATGAGESLRLLHCAGLDADALEEALRAHSGDSQKGQGMRKRIATVLLEDIERLCEAAQFRLAEILDNRQERLDRTADAQIVATSTLSLGALAGSRLRGDIFHRLAVLPLSMRPLAERRDDLPALAKAVLAEGARRHQRPLPAVTDAALRFLSSRDYPGNVPEFEALLTRALLSTPEGHAIDAVDLQDGAPGASAPETELGSLESMLRQSLANGGLSLDRLNRQIYDVALSMAGGNIASAARMLNLSRAQLAYRLRQAVSPRE